RDEAPDPPARKGETMGQPVVHFEVIGKDGDKLQGYYSKLFGWKIDASNPMNYGVVQREGNTDPDGAGIGGGVASGPEGYGGADVIQQVLEAGLLDELEIHLVPVLLGAGRSLFDRPGIGQIELERTRVIDSPAVTHLEFRVVK